MARKQLQIYGIAVGAFAVALVGCHHPARVNRYLNDPSPPASRGDFAMATAHTQRVRELKAMKATGAWATVSGAAGVTVECEDNGVTTTKIIGSSGVVKCK